MKAFIEWLKSLFKSYNETAQDNKPPEAVKVTPWVPPSIKVKSNRNLVAKLEVKIDNMILEMNASRFKDAVARKDGNTIVGLAAEALVAMNIREKTNNNDGEMVEMIQKTSGGTKGEFWCMYFSQTPVAYAERKLGIVSKLYSSGSCASVRKHSATMAIDPKKSVYGDIWIWIYSATGLGHTGIFEAWIKKDEVAALNEGNTTAGKVGDKIIRDGGGAYQTERAYETSKTSKMNLGMVIRPF